MLINLRWKIQILGMKNYEIAARANLSASKFSRALSGRSELTSNERQRVADALGVADHAWLFRQFATVSRYYVCDEPVAAMESAAR